MKFGALTLLGIWIGTLVGAMLCLALKLDNLPIIYAFIPTIIAGAMLGGRAEATGDKR